MYLKYVIVLGGVDKASPIHQKYEVGWLRRTGVDTYIIKHLKI